jgi:carbamate kinase
MLVVAALGGNALLRRGEPLDSEVQRKNLEHACEQLALIAHDHDLVVTHGNGPQIGLLALQSETYRDVRAYPLDVLGAESDGMIGYMLEQELGNRLPNRRVATMLTQVVVEANDPAFRHPTKPIGPVYDERSAKRLATERGWAIAPDGAGWRRVVASPMPRSVVELDTIALLVRAGVVVVCAGGGGIPVVVDGAGARHGVEAVIDKDRTTALLARNLGADLLLLLTDVDGVQRDFGRAQAQTLRTIHASQLGGLALDEGSMGPKVHAAGWFATATGRPAAIGALDDAAAVLAGVAGTRIVAETGETTVRAAPYAVQA